MRLVIVESPFAAPPGTPPDRIAAELDLRARYLSACLRDCILRGESPYASHGLLTRPGVLRDHVPEERDLGIRAGFAWRRFANVTAVYTDLGISGGMLAGIDDAKRIARLKGAPPAIEQRQLGADWDRARAPHPFQGDDVDCLLCGEGSRHYLHSPDPYEESAPSGTLLLKEPAR